MSELREFRFTFEVDSDNPDLERDQLRGLAEGYVRANEMAILHHPDRYPKRIEDAALRYIDPPRCKTKHPCQPVLGAGPLLDAGEETCFGLACLHCALLRVHDNDRRAYVEIEQRQGPYGPVSGRWHAVVATGRGEILDTQQIVESFALGMVAGRKGMYC